MTRKFALLSLATALAAAVTSAAAYAYALPSYSYDVSYYTDINYENEVGAGHRDCQNRWHPYWGSWTPYEVRTEVERCPG